MSTSKVIFWFKTHYPLLIILILAAALRVNLLFVRGTFWFDEIFSVHFSSLPWLETLKYWWLETNPPFYSLFLRGWLKLFGESEIIARLPSLIFGLLSIFLLYKLAIAMFSRRAAIVAGLLMSLSGIHLFISTETRVYSLLTFLTIASFWFFHKIVILKSNKKTDWWLYGTIQILFLYSHLTALPIVLIQCVVAIIFNLEHSRIRRFYRLQIISWLLFSIWFIPSLLSKFNLGLLSGWFFANDSAGSNILTTIVTLFINAELNGATFTLAAIFLVGLILWQTKSINWPVPSQTEKITILLLAWGVMPPLMGAFLGQYIPKYFVISLPALSLLIGAAIATIKNNRSRLLLNTLLFVVIVPSTITIASNPIFSWYSLTKYIEKNETNKSAVLAIPFNEALAIKYYYHGTQPVFGVYPTKDSLSLDERIARYNWQMISSDDYADWMSEHVADRDKIFFLQYDGYDSLGKIWLIKNGWKLNKQLSAKGHINITLFEFYAPDYHQATSSTSVQAN